MGDVFTGLLPFLPGIPFGFLAAILFRLWMSAERRARMAREDREQLQDELDAERKTRRSAEDKADQDRRTLEAKVDALTREVRGLKAEVGRLANGNGEAA